MNAGYSGTPLAKKLGMVDGLRALLIGVPDGLDVIAKHPGFSRVDTSVPDDIVRAYDHIHIFEHDRARLAAMASSLRAGLVPAGTLWVSWPKKAAKLPTDLTEDRLRDIFLPIGPVDVKVAAIDAIWSGLKFMFRKDIRPTL